MNKNMTVNSTVIDPQSRVMNVSRRRPPDLFAKALAVEELTFLAPLLALGGVFSRRWVAALAGDGGVGTFR